MRVEAQPLLRRPAGEGVVEGVGAGLGGKDVDEGHVALATLAEVRHHPPK